MLPFFSSYKWWGILSARLTELICIQTFLNSCLLRYYRRTNGLWALEGFNVFGVGACLRAPCRRPRACLYYTLVLRSHPPPPLVITRLGKSREQDANAADLLRTHTPTTFLPTILSLVLSHKHVAAVKRMNTPISARAKV